MLKLYEIIRLWMKGVSLLTAVRKSIIRFNQVDLICAAMIVLCLLWVVGIYLVASYTLKIASLESDKYIAMHNTAVHAQARDHSEKVLIGILNGEGIVEDGIDRPCTCGEYKNGKARYTRS